MNVVAILQARLASTRLKNKMLLPLLGKPLVQQVIERVRRATTLDFVVLAYPLADNDAFRQVLTAFRDTPGVPLGSWAGQGDESDLIERYLGAAQAYDADLIVRIPCDNPCVDPEYIDKAVKQYLAEPYTFYSNTSDWAYRTEEEHAEGTLIDGIGCEVFSLSRLKWLNAKTQGQAEWREHPHKYFTEFPVDDYGHEGGICEQYNYTQSPTLRLDVNTQADYAVITDLYDHFGHNHFTAPQIVAYLHQKEVPHALEERVQQESH